MQEKLEKDVDQQYLFNWLAIHTLKDKPLILEKANYLKTLTMFNFLCKSSVTI